MRRDAWSGAGLKAHARARVAALVDRPIRLLFDVREDEEVMGCTDGALMRLPQIHDTDLLDRDQAFIWLGVLEHETAHLLWTAFDTFSVASQRDSELTVALFQLAEDIRVEDVHRRKHPDAEDLLQRISDLSVVGMGRGLIGTVERCLAAARLRVGMSVQAAFDLLGDHQLSPDEDMIADQIAFAESSYGALQAARALARISSGRAAVPQPCPLPRTASDGHPIGGKRRSIVQDGLVHQIPVRPVQAARCTFSGRKGSPGNGREGCGDVIDVTDRLPPPYALPTSVPRYGATLPAMATSAALAYRARIRRVRRASDGQRLDTARLADAALGSSQPYLRSTISRSHVAHLRVRLLLDVSRSMIGADLCRPAITVGVALRDVLCALGHPADIVAYTSSSDRGRYDLVVARLDGSASSCIARAAFLRSEMTPTGSAIVHAVDQFGAQRLSERRAIVVVTDDMPDSVGHLARALSYAATCGVACVLVRLGSHELSDPGWTSVVTARSGADYGRAVDAAVASVLAGPVPLPIAPSFAPSEAR